MTITVSKTEPLTFHAGDTVTWTRNLPDYLPATWTLTYTFLRAEGKKTVTATDNGDDTHLATISATDSATYLEGDYAWQARVTDGTTVTTIDSGIVTVTTGFSDVTAGSETRTPARQWLAALLAARARWIANPGQINVQGDSVGNRSRTFRTIEEIQTAIYQAQQDVKREDRARLISEGLSAPRIFVRFN